MKDESGRMLKLVRSGNSYYIDGARAEPLPVHAVEAETAEADDDMDIDPCMPKEQAEHFTRLKGVSSSSKGPASTAAAGVE